MYSGSILHTYIKFFVMTHEILNPKKPLMIKVFVTYICKADISF